MLQKPVEERENDPFHNNDGLNESDNKYVFDASFKKIQINQYPNSRYFSISRHNQYLILPDKSLFGSYLMTRFVCVLLATLQNYWAVDVYLYLNYIYEQLIRIIVPKSGKNTNNCMYGRKNNTNSQVQNQHIYLLCIILNAEGHKFIYITESKRNNTNINIFNCNIELCDNGTVNIVNIIHIIAPSPITTSWLGTWWWLNFHPHSYAWTIHHKISTSFFSKSNSKETCMSCLFWS